MGHLLDGEWTDDEVLKEVRDDGKYIKFDSIFRNRITRDGDDGKGGFPAETGRYHLYSSVACPWAHRTELIRILKKLDGIIGHTDTRQTIGGQGWTFVEPHVVPGTDQSATYLHQVYALSEPAYTGRVSVPVLWDSHTRKIVSNESSEIIVMFNEAFDEIAPPSPDYYPPALREDIDAVNALVLDGINNAVNECGRGVSQQAYEAAFDKLFRTLDELEARLSRQRYLCGDRQTLADWRLFPNLVRFDAIYYLGYKCNLRRIADYPNLSEYLRDLYQTPGIDRVCDVAGMKDGVYGGAGPIPTNGIVPKGPEMDLREGHTRSRFG